MPGIGCMIRQRRRSLGLTLQQVADRVGCGRAYLSMIETGARSTPGEPLLAALEQALNLDPGQLVDAASWEATPRPIQRELEAMRQREQRAAAVARCLIQNGPNLDALLETGMLRRFIEDHTANLDGPEPLRMRVPVINDVAAGVPRDFTDLDYPAAIADDYLPCPDLGDADAFAARVVGDSMEPQYREGDVIVFSPAAATPSGSDCFVRLERDAETTFKRVFFEGDDERLIRLQPLNGKYEPRLVDREEVAGLYAAVYVMRPVGR
ncbi:MAG: helix-turn-helix domain-containing protein [Phycisphaerales bacterium]|nr:helix-turn-helix domain-containing protein [Phycisphaerales bacterium]